MKHCRFERNRFNSGKTHRDLSPAPARSSASARKIDREDVVVEFSNDMFSTVFRQTIHGPGIDEPLAIIGDRPGEYTYYLHDGLGSVTALVDAAGNLDGCYDYGAFGDERQNTVMIENRYRYTSREYVEPNLYYYRARYMRPDLGRFTSMDPLKMIDGTNMFGYVTNNPIEWFDPWGFNSICEPFSTPSPTPTQTPTPWWSPGPCTPTPPKPTKTPKPYDQFSHCYNVCFRRCLLSPDYSSFNSALNFTTCVIKCLADCTEDPGKYTGPEC